MPVMGARRRVTMLERGLADARAELAAARENVAVMTAAINALPVGVVVRTATGAEVVRNAPAREGTGDRQADALLTRSVEDALAGAAASGEWAQVLELHQPSRRALSIVARSLPAGATVAVVEDVSERFLVDAVRRDFIANVSHELRTPVGALAVLAETMLGETDLTTVRRLAERMAAESDRAVRLIEDLLDLSRVEVPGAMRREPVRVGRVIAAAIALVADGAQAAGVTVTAGEVELDLEVDGDERQITSAVRNLLDNAVKYTPEGGQVDVAVHAGGDYVSVTVHDTGVGIPARDLDRIFERFYRVDRARSRQTGGTGLGLAIVRHVAQNHGGDVTVHSIEGEGSTFTMRLRAQ